jgi:hypothetical protein
MEVSCQHKAPAALPAEKSPPALDGRLGGPQNRSGLYGEKKEFALAENWTPTVQSVPRYTDWVIPTPR